MDFVGYYSNHCAIYRAFEEPSLASWSPCHRPPPHKLIRPKMRVRVLAPLWHNRSPHAADSEPARCIFRPTRPPSLTTALSAPQTRV